MNNVPNRKAICDVLLKEAETDKDIIVLCSDSLQSYRFQIQLFYTR